MSKARRPGALLIALALASCTRSETAAPGFSPPEPGIVKPCDPCTDAKDKDKEQWDVMHPPGEAGDLGVDVTIDTIEGTWMSVDVSPDGRDVVFDLLGDLYVIPISGGQAKAITSGMAWDMQPRFSPDGQWIAFTSDRGGGDNVWVVRRDGSDARAVTEEDFRLVNSPVWSPDGRFLAVRKHFTKHRSLGAGEIWLYHASGGKGVPLTEKENDQKDVGEPAFSPDGRYVYFSKDTTPGKFFEYNKDPNPGIYSILRLDREEGDVREFLGGPGGAIRPTPSPDGNKLAFVRRVRTQSVLHVVDVASGEERPLWDGLDRDMQEAWAIHGVYPAMAWTPDSKEIVLWAGGKLWRVNAESGQRGEIKFHVLDKRRVLKALRRPVEVAPDKVKARMLRWVTVSPDGRQVVYQALGHLYVRDLPNGTPKRLTSQTDHFEFFPTYSRDGKTIAYTTWDDEALGSVRVIPAKGGRARVVTAEPGHYVEPVFTPDGDQLVYRKVSGGYMRSPTWSSDPGLYVAKVPKALSRKPASATRVTREGERPQFAADPARVYYVVEETDKDGNDSVELRSLELDGSDPRTHARSELATELAVSPDGRWLAFVEGFQGYITPLPPTGKKPVKIGPEEKGLPLAKVTRDAGVYLHWSADAQRLHWAHGPELFTRELKNAFTFVDGAPEKAPEPAERGVDISFTFDKDVPKGKTAIVGARIITMRAGAAGDREVIEDGVILIDGDRIQAVGPKGQVQVPGDAFVLDAAGRTVIPGLVDVHAHGAQGRQGIIPEQNWLHYAELAFGVTTVHDPSNDTATIFAASELGRAGLVTAPRIFSTGTILYGALAPFKAKIETLDDARSHLRRLQQVGAFSVKSYNQPRRDQRQKVLAAGRELGVMVVPEGGSLFHHNLTQVVDGHTGVEHCMPVGAAYMDVRQLWGATQVGYTPTLGVAYGGLGGENYWYAHTEVWEHPRLSRFVPRFAVDPKARRRTMAPDDDWNHLRAAKVAQQLASVGVRVLLGAHGQREGLAAHWELWMFVQGGMSPHEALRAGTRHGAEYLGLDRDIGSIEVGKLADLVVLEQNPLDDIRNTDSVLYTMVGGRLYDAASMDEIGLRPRRRAEFFFEKNQSPPTNVTPPPGAVCDHG